MRRPTTTSMTPTAHRADGERPYGRAVVLGGSLAGLLSARVLADHFEEVVVVDRDELDPALEGPRRGVPQGRHTHGLLAGGAEAIERMLPGFTTSLVARGAGHVDLFTASRWFLGGHRLAVTESGMKGLFASRPLIESEVRRRVAATPRVVLRGHHDVAGLVTSPDGRSVTGARVVAREEGAVAEELLADLVVDATGRGSRAPVWLTALGYQAPPESIVEAGLMYVTRQFRATPGVLDELNADVIGTTPPDKRGGVALRQEGGRWIVTLAGCFGEEPPTDHEGFLAYARSLPTPGIAEIASRAEPIGEPLTYRYPGSRWRHWEKLARRPEGLVVIGDAVCSFNPVYGQGMTSAALQAEALGASLDAGLAGLPERTAKAFAKVVVTPWTLATGSDRRFPGQPRKPLPERVLDRYLDRLLAAAAGDARLTVAFARVLNLLAPPPSLLAPRVAWRVLRPGATRTARAAQAAHAAHAAHAARAAQPTQRQAAWHAPMGITPST